MTGSGPVRKGFVTTGLRRFRWDSFVIQLYHKAKKLGVWDPQAIDLSEDKRIWEERMAHPESMDEDMVLAVELLLRQISLFQAGEEAVTLDLLPLIYAVARDGYLEDEMYLTTFLFEEAKHTEFFRRYLDEVCGSPENLERFHTPSYKKLFYEELPQALGVLYQDPSPRNQVRAAVTYNIIIEGMLAETGYYNFLEVMTRNADKSGVVLKGLQEGVRLIQRDESRHIAYGIYLISRHLSQRPELWEVVEERLNELLPYAQGVVMEGLEAYPRLPYDTDPQEIIDYAISQYQKRYERLKKAKDSPLDVVENLAIELGEAA